MKAIERWQDGAQLVFSEPKYRLLAAIFFLILLPIYAVLTDIIILSPLSINPNLKPLEASLILIASFFASLGFTLATFQIYEFKVLSKKEAGGMLGSSAGAGLGGSLLGIFTSACTICQPVWLVWLGLGSVSFFLTDYSIYIVLASLAVLIYSVHSGLCFVAEGCSVRRKK